MAESVERQFPNEELTPLTAQEKPSNATLRVLKRELYDNAMSVPSIRGGGGHGHLAITMSDAAYTTLAGTAFVVPTHPGPRPVHPANATGPQVKEINRQFLSDLQEFQTYKAVEAQLKKQLIKAVPNVFIDELKDQLFGYGNVAVRAILEHLDTMYRQVTPDDLNKNLDNLNRQWSPEQPLETLFTQINNCREFAEDHDPITVAAAIRAGELNLEKSGVFIDALKDWRKKATADRTWVNFKSHFNEADKERLRQLTTHGAGYLAKGEEAEKPPIQQAPETTPTKSSTKDYSAGPSLYYCWSHGLGPNPNHTSATCRRQAAGHRTDATATNMMGGCNHIHRRRGEQAVFGVAEE